jgi:hypothetical protein
VIVCLAHGLVCAEAVDRHAIGPERRAVVDKRADRNLRGEVHHAADVVVVEVRNQQVIDAGDASRASRREDPIGIPPDDIRTAGAAGARAVTGIDQQRLPGRRDDEGGLAAFDVDEENFQIPGGHRGRQQEDHNTDKGYALHGFALHP